MRRVDIGRSRDQVEAGEDEILQTKSQTHNHSQVTILEKLHLLKGVLEHVGISNLALLKPGFESCSHNPEKFPFEPNQILPLTSTKLWIKTVK